MAEVARCRGWKGISAKAIACAKDERMSFENKSQQDSYGKGFGAQRAEWEPGWEAETTPVSIWVSQELHSVVHLEVGNSQLWSESSATQDPFIFPRHLS